VLADVTGISGQHSQAAGFGLLPIHAAQAEQAPVLPRHHRDPFDRMLVAQAGSEHMILVSRDDIFDRYRVRRLHC
jgi:PIN domain nuclease of toxin-antitoxin system